MNKNSKFCRLNSLRLAKLTSYLPYLRPAAAYMWALLRRNFALEIIFERFIGTILKQSIHRQRQLRFSGLRL